MNISHGVIYIHSAPAALRPHIEWAIQAVLAKPVNLEWTRQPAQPGAFRAETNWRGPAGAGAALASALRNCRVARFEITEGCQQRYSFTPSLGMFRAQLLDNGDIAVGEQQLRTLLDAYPDTGLRDGLRALLGEEWDDELEPFRHASESTRWIYRVG